MRPKDKMKSNNSMRRLRGRAALRSALIPACVWTESCLCACMCTSVSACLRRNVTCVCSCKCHVDGLMWRQPPHAASENRPVALNAVFFAACPDVRSCLQVNIHASLHSTAAVCTCARYNMHSRRLQCTTWPVGTHR